ncbi:MAG: NAD-dependent epimerase/dehydratase family protein, partial [Sulfurovaceae bacterium]
MNIFIVGASGFIGSAIVDGLDKKDNTVFISSRLENDSRANTIFCDFSKDFSVDFWKEKLKNIDIVINAVGIISESKGQKFADLHTQAPIALFKA